MKKVSKIKAVNTAFNSWEKDGVTFHPHRYTMEDGTQIDALHKTMNPFAVGLEVEYEVKGNDKQGNPRGSVGKVSNFQQGSTGGTKTWTDSSDAILYQTCLKAISENYVARCGGTLIELNIEEIDRMATLALHLAQLSKKNIETLKNG